MIKKRGFSLSTRFHLTAANDTYWLEIWEQPMHRWLIAEIYHWYDMRIYKVPGFRALERLLERRHEDDLLHIPLGASQDCRCYELSIKKKKSLASIEISREQYERIKKK